MAIKSLFWRIPILMGLSLSMLACATNRSNKDFTPVLLDKSQISSIGNTRLIVGIEHIKIGGPADYYGAQYTYGGAGEAMAANLLGALITSKMNNNAQVTQRYLAQIRREGVEFGPGIKFRVEVEKAYRQIPWLKLSASVRETSHQIDDINSLFSQYRENNLLVNDLSYYIDKDFSVLHVLVDVVLVERGKNKTKSDESSASRYTVLYRNRFIQDYPYSGNRKEAIERAQDWAANDGAMLKSRLKESVGSLANRIVDDIRKSNNVQTSAKSEN